MGPRVPRGYRESTHRGTRLVAREDAHDVLRGILDTSTLHDWAGRQPDAKAMRGRGTTWATALPSGLRVAVRHSMRGGLMARLSRDLFLGGTRAPRELANALRLAEVGVRTAAVIGYAEYSVGGAFFRADVVTEFVEGVDLVTALNAPDAAVKSIATGVEDLLRRLGHAHAVHPDLNARNVLVNRNETVVLDVDRIAFGEPNQARAQALCAMRLAHSLRKLRASRALQISDGALAEFLAVQGISSSDLRRSD
ncbi:MAG: hypothetical protein FJ202_03345 [Gemmatimonadetes bacterium]|nr:hypothetical protein [Gemmatimonadota bacterium]